MSPTAVFRRIARSVALSSLVLSSVVAGTLTAQPPVRDSVTPANAGGTAPRGGLDITLVDAPYNTAHDGVRVPSMRQTLDLSVAAYELAHGGVERLFGRRRTLGKIAVALFDLVTTVEVTLPLTDVWVHEEFHRAALGRRGVDSFDDVYRLDVGASVIAVSRVKDADLVRIKRDHPADWVRVNEAGIEGELTLVRELERRRFFGHSTAFHLPLYWIAKGSSAGYVASADWADVDADTDEMNRHDGANVAKRDFTGHDFLAWVYDLHRPAEPYDARGVHPSGVGIDRYVKRADLTAEERRFVRRQGRLQLLNFADPFLVGLNRGITLRGGATPLRATASLGHFLTSFGHTVDANILVARGDVNAAVTFHHYRNGARAFPGVEADLLDLPVAIGGRPVALSARGALWLQPDDQRFRTTDAAPGGLASLRLRTRVGSRLAAFAEVEAKSAGWVAGTPYLTSNAALRVGVSTVRR